MGGLVGYQLKSLQLITAGQGSPEQSGVAAGSPGQSDSEAQSGGQSGAEVRYHVPPALDLAGEAGRRVGARAAAAGILSLPYMAEILPVGGGPGQGGVFVWREGGCGPFQTHPPNAPTPTQPDPTPPPPRPNQTKARATGWACATTPPASPSPRRCCPTRGAP